MTTTRAAVLLAAISLVGCPDTKPTPESETTAAPNGSAPSASSTAAAIVAPVTITVAYGSEKKTWLEESARAFESAGARTKSGKPIKIKTISEGSGEAISGIVDGTQKPHVFSPAASPYIDLLNDAWGRAKSSPKPIAPSSEPVVLSPVVVAMWQPMAESLGWPSKAIGWKDLVKINADPRGFGATGHPEWGRFKLGHTHPEMSSSGLLSIVAEAYAGAKKTRGLDVKDLDAKTTVDTFAQIEGLIVHYGKSTGFFADKMIERGPGYLSAAVLYENLVVESRSKQAAMPIVAVYPVEGTFWSDHPFAILDAPWVGADEREASQAFLDYLKSEAAQRRAMALGFRPADPKIAIGAPLDGEHGVDPLQPKTLLEMPKAPVLAKLLDVWRTKAKRASDVILCFDKSGSMAGKPLAEAKRGAEAFVGALGDRDEMTLVFFDGNVYPAFGPKVLGAARADVIARIESTIADGNTALYDVIASSYDAAQKRAKTNPEKIHAVVVMTDGRDEGSVLKLDGLKSRLGGGEADTAVRVFTIAYGDAADQPTLASIANAAKGSSLAGKTSDIVDVYREMAAFF